MKLLVNAPNGSQELIEVGEGGGYFDDSRVVWDERVDGPLPSITLGAMVRSGDTLEVSAERKTEHDAALAPELAQKAAEASKAAGIEILGVMCSATKDDQNGMVAVGTSKLMADMGGLPFADTVFEFTNGSKLVITNDNFNTVYGAWVPFRQSFFAAE